jgi:hypothetical protein
VKTWSELIRENEGRLRYIQEKLRVEVSADEIEQRIAVLKSSMQRGQAGQVVQFPQPAAGNKAAAAS